MSRFFQRTSLKPGTFDNYDSKKTAKGELEATFLTNVNKPSTKQFYSGSHYPLNKRGGERATAHQNQPSWTEPLNPAATGLKRVFDARQPNPAMPSEHEISDSSSSNSSLNHVEVDVIPGANQNSSPQDVLNNTFEAEDSLENDYPTQYHSIHRLSHFNKQGGNNLKRVYEARTGGTVRRNLGKNIQKDTMLEKHANIIVSKMEKDETLMEDSPDAEELRRAALRDMPQSLTIKRCVKVKLSKSVSQKSKRKPISWWKMFKYRLSMTLTKMKINIRDLAYSFELWYGPLRKIEGNFGTGVASYFKFLRWIFLVNCAIAILPTCFILVPKAIYDTVNAKSADWTIASDLITGEGYLTETPLYYGFYTNESISSFSNLPYSIPHAYFFTMLAIYFVSFAVIGVSAARSYRRSFIETEGGLKNIFANKIFCGWDYNIATRDASELKSKAIYNELKELISDFTRKRNQHTFYQKFLTRSIQFFMNLVIVCLIVGTAYAIWYFLNHVPTDKSRRIIVAPIFINIVMAFLPMFLSFVVRYEDYKNPKVSLYLTLARTFLLGAVTIGVLVAYWLQHDSEASCWETSLAQEFYRMIVFDFLISVVCAALLDVTLFLIYRYVRKKSYLEFDIAWNTMQIIYNQTLFWVGLVFSPLLPVVVVAKLFLIWYIRQYSVLLLCKPCSKSWRAAQTTTWFLVMTFLSLMFVGGLVGYIVSYIETSKVCGPFKNYDHIYEIVTLGVLKLRANSTVWSIVLFVTKPGVITLILLFLSARVYYSRAQAHAQKEIVQQCRNMLVWSAKDKEYYYSLISQVTKGQCQYRFHEKSVSPELYDPALCLNNEGGDAKGSIVPSSSTMSSEMDSDNVQYTRLKKYM